MASQKPSVLRLLLFVAVLFSTGCASLIYGTSQIVPVDSRPQGYPVRLLKAEEDVAPPSPTPYFERLSSGTHTHVTLKLPHAGGLKQSFDCDLRWVGSVGGNTLLALLFFSSPEFALGLGLSGLGIDYWNGALFDCSRPKVFVVPPSLVKASKQYCRRIVLLPPLDVDIHVSNRMARMIAKRYGKGETQCDSIVDYKTAKDALTYLNITHFSRPDVHRIDQQRWNRLAYTLNATHLLVPRLTANKRGPQLSVEEYDISTMQVEREIKVDASQEMAEAAKSSLSRRLYVYSLSLTPNALTYSRSTSLDLIDYRNSVTTPIIKQDRDRPIQLLSNLGIENADHPDGFGLWDYSASFYPSFNMLLWSGSYQYTDPATNQPGTYKIHFDSFLLAFNGTLTGHTPLGALSLSLGVGPSFLIANDSEGDHRRTIVPGYKVEFFYTAFITGRLFFRTGSDLNWFNSGLSSSHFDFRGYSETYAGLGVFLPTVRSHAIEFLDSDSDSSADKKH